MTKLWWLPAALIAASGGAVRADDPKLPTDPNDPKFQFAKKDEVKDVHGVEWHATAEAGAVFTTGNSETTTATGGIRASRKEGDDKLSLEGTAAYAKSSVFVLQDLNGNGTIDDASEIKTASLITAETLYGKLRYDRFLTDANSLYIAALGSRDVPAGKLAVYGGQVGYSRQLFKSALSLTVAEIGYDFSHEHLATGSPVSIHSARGFIGHHATMTEGTVLDASAEVLTNLNHLTLPTHQDGSALEDTRINIRLAISAKIGRNLAVQTAFEAHYDHRPGPLAIKPLAMGFVPAAEPLDTIMKAQLIYTFAGTDTPAKKKCD